MNSAYFQLPALRCQDLHARTATLGSAASSDRRAASASWQLAADAASKGPSGPTRGPTRAYELALYTKIFVGIPKILIGFD